LRRIKYPPSRRKVLPDTSNNIVSLVDPETGNSLGVAEIVATGLVVALAIAVAVGLGVLEAVGVALVDAIDEELVDVGVVFWVMSAEVVDVRVEDELAINAIGELDGARDAATVKLCELVDKSVSSVEPFLFAREFCWLNSSAMVPEVAGVKTIDAILVATDDEKG
jgi:hypothetical protein